MEQYSNIDPNPIRIRLLKILDKTLTRYQDILRKNNELQSNGFLPQNSAKSSELSFNKSDELTTKSRWLKKYLQSLMNALMQIDNGSYVLRKSHMNLSHSER